MDEIKKNNKISRYLRSNSLKIKRDVTQYLSLYGSETQLLFMDDICLFAFTCPIRKSIAEPSEN